MLFIKLLLNFWFNEFVIFFSKIIAPTQVVFVPGRWIVENSILVQEVMYTLKHKKGRGCLMAIKIDMQKAFDKID